VLGKLRTIDNDHAIGFPQRLVHQAPVPLQQGLVLPLALPNTLLHGLDLVELCIINHSIQIWPPTLPPEHARLSELSRQPVHPGCATLHNGWVYHRQPKNRIPCNLFHDFAVIFSFGIAFAYASPLETYGMALNTSGIPLHSA
jgi:hypothetical protein